MGNGTGYVELELWARIAHWPEVLQERAMDNEGSRHFVNHHSSLCERKNHAPDRFRAFKIFAFKCGVVAIVMVGFATGKASEQKVKFSADSSADFAHYRRYGWSQNYLVTRQRPDDQRLIGATLTNSINHQLQAKAFILDEKNPDFRISYEAGALTKADVSVSPDLSRGATTNPNALDQVVPSIGPGVSSLDAWISVFAGIRITVTDCASQKNVWIGQMSKKIKNPQRAMLNMEAEVDAAVAKIMQSFPPRSNKSRLFASLDGRPAYSLGFNAYVTSTP
jgi:hypothetical protein